jgi:F-type H+-transporting ATPase subunit a
MFRLKEFVISLLCMFLLFPVGMNAENEEGAKKSENIDARAIVLGHLQDSYHWHITSLGESELSISLPVILYSGESGWHIFSSSNLFPEGKVYQGFTIATQGEYEGKIVEVDKAGNITRPFDISITKTVLGLLINSSVLLIIVLSTAFWYRKKTASSKAPKGFVGFMELFIVWVEDDVIKACIGKGYEKYSPYLLTAFFFIFVNNLMGLIPIFPAGSNVTGNIAVTLVLAVCTFLAVNIWGSKEYWKEILWPEVPVWLKCPVPFMPLIEIFGIFTKPFALMIRLFANILAGHSVILALTSIIFVTVSMGPMVNGAMTFVSFIFTLFMNLVELLVAFIQAYVFTMLSAVFIGLSRIEGKEEHAK